MQVVDLVNKKIKLNLYLNEFILPLEGDAVKTFEIVKQWMKEGLKRFTISFHNSKTLEHYWNLIYSHPRPLSII